MHLCMQSRRLKHQACVRIEQSGPLCSLLCWGMQARLKVKDLFSIKVRPGLVADHHLF